MEKDCAELLDKTIMMHEELRELKRRNFDWRLQHFNDLKRSREVYYDNCYLSESVESRIHHLGQFDLAMGKIAVSLLSIDESTRVERAPELRDILSYFSQEELDSIQALDDYSGIDSMSPGDISNAIYTREGNIYTMIKQWFVTQNDTYNKLATTLDRDRGRALVSTLKTLYEYRFKRIGEGIVEFIRKYPNAAGKLFEEYGEFITKSAEVNSRIASIVDDVERQLDGGNSDDVDGHLLRLRRKLEELDRQIEESAKNADELPDLKSKSIADFQLQSMNYARKKITQEQSRLAESAAISNVRKEIPSKKSEFLKGIEGINSKDVRSGKMRFFGRFKRSVEATILQPSEYTIKTHDGIQIHVKGKKDWNLRFYDISPNDGVPDMNHSSNGAVVSYSFVNRHFLGSDNKFYVKSVFFVHTLKLREEGEDFAPMDLDDFIDMFQKVRNEDGRSEVIGFASPTGFSDDLISFVNPPDGGISFSDSSVSIVLIDLRNSKISYNPSDRIAVEYLDLYGFESPDDKLLKVRQCVLEIAKVSDPCHILDMADRLSMDPAIIYPSLKILQDEGIGKIVFAGNDSHSVESVMFKVTNSKRR